MNQALALGILTATVGISLGRPRLGRWKLGHVEGAVLGAMLALATGVVTANQALQALGLLAIPAITIISLMAITIVAEQAGLLNLIAYRIARRANGDGRRLFRNLFIFGALTGTFFTNDAAILILTPLVYKLVNDVREPGWSPLNQVPFYFAILYVGNLAGALIISNPINLIVSSIFGIGFTEYALWMILPSLVSMVVSYSGLKYYFRSSIPKSYQIPSQASAFAGVDRGMILPCGLILAAILISFFSEELTGIPVWVVATIGAGFAIISFMRRGYSAGTVIRGIGWDVIIFVVGIFIVVLGLRNQGFAPALAGVINQAASKDMLGLTMTTGYVAAFSSAIFNNHPTAGLMAWVVQSFDVAPLQQKILALAALIGGDLGPKMLPIGSLAALMWFRMLRTRGVQISYLQYVRIGLPVTLAAVGLSLFTLWLEWTVYEQLLAPDGAIDGQ